MLLAASATLAQAQPQPWAGLGTADYHAEEPDGAGGVFNRETGRMRASATTSPLTRTGRSTTGPAPPLPADSGEPASTRPSRATT